MTRNVKLTIAAVATALVATFGMAGTSSTVAGPTLMKKDHSWCC